MCGARCSRTISIGDPNIISKMTDCSGVAVQRGAAPLLDACRGNIGV